MTRVFMIERPSNIPVDEISKDDWNVIVVHGSTDTHYQRNNPLVHLLLKFFPKVYSIDLPGHGSPNLKDQRKLDLDTALRDFSSSLHDLVNQSNVLYVGYSLGGLFGLKCWEHFQSISNKLIGVIIGAGSELRPEILPFIEKSFSDSAFLDPITSQFMREKHGPSWRDLAQSLQNWISSPDLYLHPEGIQSLEGTLHLIISENDYLFSFEESYRHFQNGKTDSLSIDFLRVPGEHNDYFHWKVGWPKVSNFISNICSSLS